ncbi:unnamed protein product [Acanthoscelides obtectus]|uniref:RING-type E3 ubiquitin transferase n=3 Tax=Acanthoscelides obtectus TaxID=200917 RepID=A0A9P0PUN6_ACAOB|nr:unnamed protein product [Acanthoscelides obtectus]CAK1657394.1 E3 ubiquitin-protein ligase sina [Acanthoscelides obtectus]
MAEQSMSSFVDEILEMNCLSCVICKEVLRPPIMLTQNLGNVCSTCYEEKCELSQMTSLPNEPMEKILKLMKLPCRYKQKGCEETLSYEDLLTHQNSCRYRTKLCALFRFTGCDWEGNRSDFATHFKECHGDHVINFENNIFFLETSLRDLNLVKLLIMNKKVYILRMQTNPTKKKLFYMICNVKDEHSSFCEYSVKHKGSSDNYIKTKSKILSSYNIYNEFDENIAVQVDLEALKQISQISDTITNIFKIKAEESRAEHLDEKILHFFECPVCKNYMKPPIYQCQSGHSICNSCRPRLEKCPTCRAIFGSTRNYSLEGLTSGVQYPCLYHDLGCPETAIANVISRHERECQFKPYSCPFTNCTSTGNYHTMINHLIAFHSESVIYNGATGYTDSFRLDNTSCCNKVFDRKCVIAFNQIFRLSCKKNADHCLWAAEVYGSNIDMKTYVYGVTLMDMRRPEKKFIRTDYCLSDVSEEELSKRCIMFPNSILSSYSNHGMLTFHFNIKEK